jgi:hypothetical protein
MLESHSSETGIRSKKIITWTRDHKLATISIILATFLALLAAVGSILTPEVRKVFNLSN